MKTFKNKRTGALAYYKDGILKQDNCCVEIGFEPSSEYWEEVVEKVILTTYDGVELFGGESVYGVTNTFDLVYCSSFRDYDSKHLKIFTTKENAAKYRKEYENYKTVDGKQIVDGDSFYLYDSNRYKCLYSNFGHFKSSKWDGKRYRTEEEVEELILMNKPCLSLNELLDNWGEVGSKDYYLKSPMFFNFKKFAKNKIKNEQ